MTAVFHVFDYMFGIAAFGLLYYILNGIIPSIRSVSLSGDILDWANYMWWGSLIVYLIFGAFYFLNALKLWQFERKL